MGLNDEPSGAGFVGSLFQPGIKVFSRGTRERELPFRGEGTASQPVTPLPSHPPAQPCFSARSIQAGCRYRVPGSCRKKESQPPEGSRTLLCRAASRTPNSPGRRAGPHWLRDRVRDGPFRSRGGHGTSGHLSHLGVQADTKCASNLQHSRKARIAILAQRPVQALSAESGIARDLGHAPRASDIAKSTSNPRGIVRSLFEPGIKIRGHLFGGTKLFGDVICKGLGLVFDLSLGGRLFRDISHDVVLLQVLGKSYGGLDILGLCRLDSSGKQHDQVSATLGVVDPVPRAKVDLQLADAVREDAMLAGIAVDKAVNPDLDACATCKVFQGVDPVTIDLGNPHRHALSVACGLRMSRGSREGWARSSGSAPWFWAEMSSEKFKRKVRACSIPFWSGQTGRAATL